MAKKKKKKPIVSAKVQYAQKMKNFDNRLLQIARACNAEEEFKKLPKQVLKVMHMSNYRPFDLKYDEELQIPKPLYKNLKTMIVCCLKNTHFKYIEDGEDVSLYDHYYAGECIRTIMRNTKGEDYKDPEAVDKIVEAFKPIVENQYEEDGPHETLIELAEYISTRMSLVKVGYWLFHVDMYSQGVPCPEAYTYFRLEYVPPETKLVQINGKKRTVYRVGLAIHQSVVWIKLTAKQLNIETSMPDIKMDVYIQDHALRRIKERLDGVQMYYLQALLAATLFACDIVKNSKGQSLMSFTVLDHKLGYLVYEYIDGIIVIKTFLLLTSNDTPEGEKLNKLMHLEKNDRQFLDMDKLSHFAKSDIPQNKALFEKFKEAGCADLFNISDDMLEEDIKANKHAALIEEYINFDKTPVMPF